MDETILRILADQGSFAIMCGVLFMFYRKDVRQYTDLWKEQATLNREQTNSLINSQQATTVAITQNTEVLRALHKRMDKLELIRVLDSGEVVSQPRQHGG